MSSVSSQPPPTSTPTPGSNNAPDNPTSSSSLYLYTFLATLLLLLGISGAIVFRSVLLRRRTRRMIEEAIRNGTWIPPTPKVPFTIGKKPIFYDAHTILNTQREDISLKEKASLWSAIKPVSVTLVRASSESQSTEQLSIEDDSHTTSSVNHRHYLARLLRWRDFSSSPPATPGSPEAVAAATHASISPTQQFKMATVSVMVAMPTPPEYKVSHMGDECPAVEFGIADVELRHGWSFMGSID